MADSNPFSALTESNNEEIDQNYEEIDSNFDESENFEFKSLVPDAKVEIPNGDLEAKIVKSGPSLLACSSIFGYLVAGNSEGFLLVQTQKLRDVFYKAEKGSRTPLNDAIQVNVEGKVLVVSLSLDQLQLLVGVSSGKVLVYNVHDVVTKKADAKPVQTIQLDDELTFIRSDSQGHPDIIAVGTKNKSCKVIKYMTNQVLCTIPNVTDVSFSPLGNQLACGSQNGVILVYDIEGNKVNEIQPPAAMKAGHGEEKTDRYVNGILWIEENVYLAIYSRPSKNDYDHTPYIINTEQQNPDDCYIYLDEVTPIFSEEAAPLSHFYFRLVRNFGSDIKTLIIVANTGCTSVSVVAQNSDKNTWTALYLENAPTTPLTPDFGDTYPVGIDVDFSASESLPPFDASDDNTPVSPFPVLYVSSNDGALGSYHVYDKVMARNGEKFSGMVDAKDVNTIPVPQPVETAPPANANEVGFNGPTEIPSFSTLPRPEQPEVKEEPTNTPPTETPTRFGAFGQPLGFSTPSQTTPFASLQRSLSDKTKVPAGGYGSNAFGTNDSTPTFGTPSFSSATTNTGGSGVPAFGGFKNVKMDNGNLFGAKSFVSDTTPSSGPSFTFKPSTLDSKDEPEKKEQEQPRPSAFSIPEKKEQQPRQSAFSIPEKKEEEPRPSAFSVPEKNEEQSRPSAFSIPAEKKEEQPTTAKTKEPQQDDFSIPEKKEEQRQSAYSIPEKNDESATTEKNDETPFSAFEPSDTQSVKKKSSDDFSFEDLKRTIDDSDSGSEITKISSIHDDDEEEQPQESDVSSESSGVHITEDQLHDEEEENQLTEQKTKEEDQKKKDEEEAAQKQNEEERKKKEEEEAERKKKEEEEAAIRKKKEEEEEAARKKKEEEERERLEAERRERERIEAEKREAERIERERLEAEQRERERIEAEKREAERIERERLEAIENTRFAHAENRDTDVVPSKRSTGLHPMAKEFEEIYFKTSEDLELNHNMLQNIRDNLDVQSKTTAKLLNDTALKNQEQVWKISDSEDISVMLNTLIDKSKADRDTQINTKEKLDDLFNADERLLSKTDDITAYVEEKNFKEPFAGVDMNEEYQIQYDQVQDKLKDVEATLKTVEDKLDDSKKSTKEVKRDNLSTYALRRAKRDIDQSIKKQQSILMRMEEQELKLSMNDSKSDKYLSRVSKRNTFLTTLFNGVTPKNVNA